MLDQRCRHTFSKQQNRHRSNGDLQIEKEARIAHIPDVQGRLILGGNIPSSDHLRPAREPRPHLQASRAFARLIAGEQRPGADKRHIAAQNVQQLRQFIEFGAAQKIAKARCAFGVLKTAAIGAVDGLHRAKFVKLKGSSCRVRGAAAGKRPGNLNFPQFL